MSIDGIVAEEFSRKLFDLMQKKDLSQSDLARLVWGTKVDARGYEVAKGRDRISAYLAGKSLPEKANLKKLAEVLDVAPEDLVEFEGPSSEKAKPGVQITAIAGVKDKVYLTVNQVVTLQTASEIMSILARAT